MARGAIDHAGSNFAREHGPDVFVRLGGENSKRSRKQRERCRELEAYFECRARSGPRHARRKRWCFLRRRACFSLRGHEGPSSLIELLVRTMSIFLLHTNKYLEKFFSPQHHHPSVAIGMDDVCVAIAI